MEMVIIKGEGTVLGEFEASHCNQGGRRRALSKLFWEDMLTGCTKNHCESH